MTENMSFGDWRDVTPEAMKTYSEEKLHLAMRLNNGGVYDTWARAEIQRRQNERLAELLNHLENAIFMVQQEVVNLTNSSTALQGLTGTLVNETTHVHREVALLTDSSGKLETLTNTLKTLTIWLILFAGMQIAIAVVQTWKMFQDAPLHQAAPVSAPQEPKQ